MIHIRGHLRSNLYIFNYDFSVKIKVRVAFYQVFYPIQVDQDTKTETGISSLLTFPANPKKPVIKNTFLLENLKSKNDLYIQFPVLQTEIFENYFSVTIFLII